MPHIKGNPVKATPDLGLRGVELLDKIIEIIEAHPEMHNQRSWAVITNVPGLSCNWDQDIDGDSVPESCGTAMCVAGWAAHLCGGQFRFYAMRRWNGMELSASKVSRVDDGTTVAISEFASHVLGLNPYDAGVLFDEDNSLDRIKEFRDKIANGEPIYLPEED
jgi:hypothetical protein